MADYQKILYAVADGVARITLNRPDKRNTLDAEIITELRSALDEAARDESARVVLLAGAGKDFCSGADLAALQRISAATVMENVVDARNLAELFIEMRRHSRPIVAQLAAKSASTVMLAKNLLYHMDGMTFETALEAGVHLNAITRMTEDCKRGVERFLKK